MAKKLYIFGIGGTGSRVLKSLTMLLAAGVRLRNDFDTVVPIIIDPDISNGDLQRTKSILRLYQEIRQEIHEPEVEKGFFAQRLKTINEINDESATINPDYFLFDLERISDTTFRDFIYFLQLQNNWADREADQSFVRLLYSDHNLESRLNVGFKGNPNMGSVVLNQFTSSDTFQLFENTFQPGDAIFIINSIFGGTGAAGFPLLLKTFREHTHVNIREAPVAAITYLPYFSLDSAGEISANTFEEKAKVALGYYQKTIIEANQLDALYFIGHRDGGSNQSYAVGGRDQRNKAHFFELAGALAALDFCSSAPFANGGRTTIKEYGIERDVPVITFKDLSAEDRLVLAHPLTKFKLFTTYLNKGLERSLGVSRWTKSKMAFIRANRKSSLDETYFASSEYENQIKRFNNYFDEWLVEMAGNSPGFNPFEDSAIVEGADNLFGLVKGYPINPKFGFSLIDRLNNELIDEMRVRSSMGKKHTTLIKLFNRSLDQAMLKAGLTLN